MSTDYLDKHVVVELDGVLYDSWRHPGLLSSVSVELTTDKSGEANVGIYDPEFKFTDTHLDSTGMKRASVRVWMGFGPNVQFAEPIHLAEVSKPNSRLAEGPKLAPPLFEGLLTRHGHDGQIATFTFDDHTSRMKQHRRSRYHNKVTDLGLLRKLAGEYGLDFVVNGNVPDSSERDVIIQFSQTDWQLAMETARYAGLRLYVRNQTLYVQEAGRTGAVVAELVYKGQDGDFVMLQGMSLSHKLPENKRGRPGRVEVRTHGRAGRLVSGVDDSDGSRGTDQVAVESLRENSEREARRRARARRYLQREDAFDHRIRLLPMFLQRNQPIMQGETVRLLNVGAFYSDKYIVKTALYKLSSSAFTCELSLKRDVKGLKKRRQRRASSRS